MRQQASKKRRQLKAYKLKIHQRSIAARLLQNKHMYIRLLIEETKLSNGKVMHMKKSSKKENKNAIKMLLNIPKIGRQTSLSFDDEKLICSFIDKMGILDFQLV